jgi:SAM-dependent methyltransferase
VTDYSTGYFRGRKMGQALTAPYDTRTAALKSYRRAARMLRIQPGMRVLDAGCGLGAGAWFLAMHGAQVTGVDVSPDAVAWAQETYGRISLRQGGSLAYETRDLLAWAPPAAYDAVIVGDVLEHFNRRAGGMLLRRLLNGLDIPETPPTRGWRDGLFLHLPITANLIDWALLVKNGLLRKRLRGEVIDHHGDRTHVTRYSVRDVPLMARAAGGCVTRVELRVYGPRLRLLERAMLTGGGGVINRLTAQAVTDCDAIILPELVAALRVPAPEERSLPAQV